MALIQFNQVLTTWKRNNYYAIIMQCVSGECIQYTYQQSCYISDVVVLHSWSSYVGVYRSCNCDGRYLALWSSLHLTSLTEVKIEAT